MIVLFRLKKGLDCFVLDISKDCFFRKKRECFQVTARREATMSKKVELKIKKKG